MPRWPSVDIFVDPNPNCPEGCSQRFQAAGETRAVTSIRYYAGADDSVLCDIAGWSSRGGGSPCPAFAVIVDDSGAGVSTLVYGGDWGLRVTPRDGRKPFGEPYLLLDAQDVVA